MKRIYPILALVASMLPVGGVCGQTYYPGQIVYPHPPILIDQRVVEQPKAKQPASGCVGGCPCDCGDTCDCKTKPCGKPGCLCVVSKPKVEQAPPEVKEEERPNFGIMIDKLSHEPRYLLNGKEITRDKAHRVVEAFGDGIPDETGLLRVAVIGTQEKCNQVAKDIESHPAFANIKSKLLVQTYRADDPIITSRGFITSGDPTIYLMRHDGEVLARNLDGQYHGPEKLAEAILVQGKPYLPDSDKDLAKPKPKATPMPDLSSVPQWVWFAAGGGVLLLLLNRKQQ